MLDEDWDGGRPNIYMALQVIRGREGIVGGGGRFAEEGREGWILSKSLSILSL